MVPAPKPRLRPALVNSSLMLLVLLVLAALTEGGLRLFLKDTLRLIEDERSLLYQYDSTLGWSPKKYSAYRFTASRPITVVHNSQGFRGPEPRTNGCPGVLFLGDSFVWGYDVNAEERFTDKLQARHPEWNIYNLGVSGYGTDQEFLLLQLQFAAYKPRVVFLVFSAETDEGDNRTNARYAGYYKPYCRVEGNRLLIEGIPVPRSERVFLAEHPRLKSWYLARLAVRAYYRLTGPPILQNPSPTAALMRNLQKYVESEGATLLAGLTGTDPALEQYLAHCRIPFVDLSNPMRYPTYGFHWTPEGHTFVCEKIEQLLVAGKYLEQGASPEK